MLIHHRTFIVCKQCRCKHRVCKQLIDHCNRIHPFTQAVPETAGIKFPDFKSAGVTLRSQRVSITGCYSWELAHLGRVVTVGMVVLCPGLFLPALSFLNGCKCKNVHVKVQLACWDFTRYLIDTDFRLENLTCSLLASYNSTNKIYLYHWMMSRLNVVPFCLWVNLFVEPAVIALANSTLLGFDVSCKQRRAVDLKLAISH